MSGNCAGFEPQRFRPNFCKNCLKLKTEHSNTPAPIKVEEPIEQPQQQNNNAVSQVTHAPPPPNPALRRPPQLKRESLTSSHPQNNPPSTESSLPSPPSNANANNNNSNTFVPTLPTKTRPASTFAAAPLSSPSSSQSSSNVIANTNSNPNTVHKRLSHSTGGATHKGSVTPPTSRITPRGKGKRNIRMSYIQQQQTKGEVPNATKFIQQILLRSVLVEGMKLSVNDSEDLIRRAQGCLKTKQNEKVPVILLDKKGREFLRNHMQQIETFLEEQEDLKNVIQTQSLVRRFLLLKKFRDLDKGAIAQLKRRNDNYFDLIRTEKQYVQTLDRMVEHYILPLRHSDLIAPYECASIFSNLEVLGEEHKVFLKKLQKLDERFPFVTGVGKVFLDISSLLKGYSVYVSNFKNAINEVERLQSENPKFEAFLSEKSANWIDLTTILSMPLNRMTQYEHLMKNLSDNLKQGTEDYDDCIKAISVLSQSSSVIEINLVQSADTAKIQACQRKLRADGPVALIKAGRKLHCELKTKKNSVFIFSDIVIVAKPQSKSKSHRESHRGGIKSKEEILRVHIHCDIQEVELIDVDPKNLELKAKDAVEKIPFLSSDEKTKWMRLFKSVLEEKNRVKERKVFGVPMADTVVREERSNGIPTVVEKTICHITQHHLQHPGIFRVAGSKAEIDKLKAIFDLGGEEVKQLDLLAFGAFSVCDVMKLFFRCLPEPLLGYNLYKPIVTLMHEGNDELTTEEKVPSMKELVLMWTPPFAVKVLKYLLKFLLSVASFVEVNKMSTSNLSIVFGPTLLWSETNTLESAMDMPYINSFVQALIDHQEAIFVTVRDFYLDLSKEMAKQKQKGRIIFSMITKHDDELALSYNNVVELDEEEPKAGSDWYMGEYKGKKGLVPKNYIELVDIQGIEVNVICDYTPAEENGQYLHLIKGEKILLLSFDSSGWDVGFKDSQLGAIPHSYIEIINPSSLFDVRELFFEKEELPLIQTLCNVIDTACCEAFAKDLTLLFEHHDATFKLLKTIIQDEVDKTKDEATLFRKNNLCSYIMTSYARFIGKNYLRDTLSPLINHIASSKQSCEIDPHKGNKEELEENMKNLRRLSQMFFHAIMESISKVPIALKQTCNLLRDIVFKSFPKSRRRVVGGFYFLRFICPAVVSPEGFGVIDKIEPKTRRSLILISKIIQTLSNGLEFGKKEEYMIPMNSFINENLENAHFVLDKISSLNVHEQQLERERMAPLSDEEYDALLHRLHSQLYGSINKVIAEVGLYDPSEEYKENLLSVVFRAGPPLSMRSLPPPSSSSSDLPKQSSSNPPSNPSPSSSSLPPATPNSPPNVNINLNNAPLPSIPPSSSSSSSSSSSDHQTKIDKEKNKKEKSKQKGNNKESSLMQCGNSPLPPPSPSSNNHQTFLIAPPEGDVLAEGFLSKKTKSGFSVQWVKKYYSLFSGSTKLFYSNSAEDVKERRMQGYIELYPSYNISKLGKSKSPSGWEIRILTADTQDFHFIFHSEDEMKNWISVLEQRLSDLLLPSQSIRRKDEILVTMQNSLDRYTTDLEIIKIRIEKSKSEEERAIEHKRLEELTERYSELVSSMEKVKRDREQLLSISKSAK